MTNKQAIEKLNDIRCHVKETSIEEQALVMAIEALKKAGIYGDIIYREDALMCLTGEYPADFKHDELIAKFIRRIRKLPSAQPVATDTNVGGKISKFIDGLEEIFADFRERHVDDSVCGLCEYDGAYVGQSGDWCNECPGFEKDDCFKLSDKTRKEWTEEIIKALPSVQLATDTNVGDTISQQAAIELAMKYCPDDDGTVQCGGDIRELLDELENLPSAVSPHNDDYTEFIDDLLAYEERNDMFNLTTKERAEFQSYVRERMEL